VTADEVFSLGGEPWTGSIRRALISGSSRVADYVDATQARHTLSALECYAPGMDDREPAAFVDSSNGTEPTRSLNSSFAHTVNCQED
jgi:hypothetical protein